VLTTVSNSSLVAKPAGTLSALFSMANSWNRVVFCVYVTQGCVGWIRFGMPCQGCLTRVLTREVAMFREHRHSTQFDQETLEFSDHLRRFAAVVMVVAATGVIMIVRPGRTAIRRRA